MSLVKHTLTLIVLISFSITSGNQYLPEEDDTKGVLVRLSKQTYLEEEKANLTINQSNILNGIFHGQVLKEGMVSVVFAKFQLCEDGILGATYAVKDSGDDYSIGQLSGFTWESSHVLNCIWQDAMGSGQLKILFTENYDRFAGFQVEGDQMECSWNAIQRIIKEEVTTKE
ncbi:MAG: hypothetical protein MK193_09700 [Lentisphaeria bacterium]|nr:hypothetical protein [Lentisphaeria bacterium]